MEREPSQAESSAADIESGLNDPLLRAISVGACFVDPQGYVLFANDAAASFVRMPRTQLTGLPIAEFLDFESTSQVSDDGFQDCRLHRIDGTSIWVAVTFREIGDQGTMLTMVDVTERREREALFRARIDSQDVIAQFAELLLLGEDPEFFLPSAARLLARELGMPLVALASISQDGSEVDMRACAGPMAESDPLMWSGKHPVPEASATAAAFETGRSVTIEDFENTSTYEPGPISVAAGARSVACVPFAQGAGMLAAISPDSCAIDEDAVTLLETVARLLATRWPD